MIWVKYKYVIDVLFNIVPLFNTQVVDILGHNLISVSTFILNKILKNSNLHLEKNNLKSK